MTGYLKDNIMYEGANMEKPSIKDGKFWTNNGTKPDFELLKAANEMFAETLASAPQLPAIGFEGEGVRHYDRQFQINATPAKISEKWIDATRFEFDGYSSLHRRIVAVPAIPVKQDKTKNMMTIKEFEQEENAACLHTPEPPPVVNEKGSGEVGDEQTWKYSDWIKFVCWYSGMKEQSVVRGIRQYSIRDQDDK